MDGTDYGGVKSKDCKDTAHKNTKTTRQVASSEQNCLEVNVGSDGDSVTPNS